MTGCVSTIFGKMLIQLKSTVARVYASRASASPLMWLSFLEQFEGEHWEEMKAGGKEGEKKEGVKEETESHREGRDKRAANDKQRARDKPLEGKMKARGASEDR